jgi:hypothetical protein
MGSQPFNSYQFSPKAKIGKQAASEGFDGL